MDKTNTSYAIEIPIVTIAKKLGFVILELEEFPMDINGIIYTSMPNECIKKTYGNKIICLNKSINNAMKRVTIANSIGYYIANNINSTKHIIKNNELNKFAMILLMNKTIFSSEFKKLKHLPKMQIVNKLSYMFFVPQKYIVQRINELHLI